jgi:glycerate kinase
MEQGARIVFPSAEFTIVPMADGGEGTVQALVEATRGRLLKEEVGDPLRRPIQAQYGVLGDGRTAVIEMAAASGLPLLAPEERNPLITSTYGTGQLVRAALGEGCTSLIIGIGGSATVDGGAGMAQALGAVFLDADGRALGAGGGELGRLDRIEMSGFDARAMKAEVLVASDVDNPLLGVRGAARVFGPQKGATPEMVEVLESNLRRFAEIVRRDLGRDIADLPGAGAAGGLGAGLAAFLGAKMRPGVEIIAEAAGLEDKMRGSSLVITGEGKLDRQTAFGKTVAGVAAIAKRCGVPVMAIAGSLGEGAEEVLDHGLDAMADIIDRPMELEEALADAPALIRAATERSCRLLAMGMSVRKESKYA